MANVNVVIVTARQDGKIELTKDELQKMLDDAYSRGYADGNRTTTITYPSYPMWYNTTAKDNITLCGTDCSS